MKCRHERTARGDGRRTPHSRSRGGVTATLEFIGAATGRGDRRGQPPPLHLGGGERISYQLWMQILGF